MPEEPSPCQHGSLGSRGLPDYNLTRLPAVRRRGMPSLSDMMCVDRPRLNK